MQHKIATGNTVDSAHQQDRSGWFVGQFMPVNSPANTRDVEIKWGVHAAGDTNEGFCKNRTAKTVSILIEGRFSLTFQGPDGSQTVMLERKGDYALWDAGITHNWAALEDSVVLTVRWPSLPHDHVHENSTDE